MSGADTGQGQTSGVREFPFTPGEFHVTSEMNNVYQEDGALIVKNLFSEAEVEKIKAAILANKSSISDRAHDLDDGAGRAGRLIIWNQPGSDVTGMVARVEKVARTCQDLLGGEIYHYHSKLNEKEPKTGGKFLWHQDYGYWYKNGCLRPDLISVFMPIHPCVRANGCLQIVKGSHRCGRIEHEMFAGQTQADPERLQQILKHFQHVHVEMGPGDALFFHCNILHTSDKNDSDMRRSALLSCYNRADNDPVYVHHHAQYTPLDIVPDSSILDCENITDLSGKDIMDPAIDKTTKGRPQTVTD